MTQPLKDMQTVTSEGQLVKPFIDGVRIKFATTLPDERGTVCEMFSCAWDFDDAPLVYAYQVTIRPQKARGWVVHRQQVDRLFVSQGTLKIVLYDDRADSATHRMLSEIYLSEHNRGLIRIPPGVYHVVQNVGLTDALFVNFPTRPYQHANPDKYRLPLNNSLIPYNFPAAQG